MSGEGDLKDNPVMRCFQKLTRLRSELNNQVKSTSWENLLRNSPVCVLGRIWKCGHCHEKRELFRDCHGPKTIFGILDVFENLETLATGFSVVAMAATANEFFKESYEIKDR